MYMPTKTLNLHVTNSATLDHQPQKLFNFQNHNIS